MSSYLADKLLDFLVVKILRPFVVHGSHHVQEQFEHEIMDAITQVQNYVHTMATIFAHSVEQLHFGVPPAPKNVSPDSYDATAIEEKARLTAQRFSELDLLISSLPKEFKSAEQQFETISTLAAENQAALERLERAKADAGHYF